MIIFREAKNEDAKLLWQWRNDELTRQQSIQQDKVPFESHKKWFESSLASTQRIIWMAVDSCEDINKSEPIGTIRVDKEDAPVSNNEAECWTLSWTLAPHKRGLGLGKKMLSTFLAQSKKSVFKADIKESNLASIKIAEFSGMDLISKNNKILTFIYKPKDEKKASC